MLCTTTALSLALAFGQLAEHLETWPDGTERERYEFVLDTNNERVRHGDYESFFEDGQQESKGRYENGAREGKWSFRWPNGERRSMGRYNVGEREGKWGFFTESGGADVKNSGVYRVFEVFEEDGSGVRGPTLDKAKHGLWIYYRTGGQVLFEGNYERGDAEGRWVLYHADWNADPELLTGMYLDSERKELLSAPLPTRTATVSTWEPDPELTALVVSLAEGDGESGAAAGEVQRSPQTYFPVVAWRLAACDLATEEGDEQARRLHEALSDICGAGWDWADFDEDGSLERNRLTAARWGTVWELIRGGVSWEETFTRKWIPRVDVEYTVLSHPPAPPRFRWQGPDKPLVPKPYAGRGLIGIGGGPAGRFGMRYRGKKSLRVKGGAGAGKAIDKGLSWIAEQVDLEASGDLSEGELYALLTFFAGTYELSGEHGSAIESPLIRLVLTQVDRQAGREAPPREVRLRALETLVLAEAELMGLRRLPPVRQALEWAVKDLTSAQSQTGSFPRRVGDARGDASTTALAWLALTTAGEAGRSSVPPDTKGAATDAREWLVGAIGRARGPISSEERDPEAPTSEGCATAMTIFTMVVDGGGVAEVAPQIKWLGKNPPRLDRPDYLMHGTYAAFHVGGDVSDDWNREMKKRVFDAQLEDGSWPAAGPRDVLATTALMVLTLQAYYRYTLPGWGRR